MDDIFRSFFGFNKRDSPGQWQGRDNQGPSFPDSGDPEDPSDSQPPHQDGFSFQSPDGGFSFSLHFPEPDQMFRHFEKMFRDMGLSEFPGSVPALPGPQQPASPRDEMLKKPDTPHHPPQQPSPRQPPGFFMQPWEMPSWTRDNQKQDEDLDKEVEKRGLDAFLSDTPEEKAGAMVPPHQPSHSYSFSTITIRTLPDGSVEEHRTVRDSTGRDETTVRRIKDGQEHSISTEDGPTDELRRESWRYPGPRGRLDPQRDLMPPGEHVDEQTKSIFKNIFGFTFPGFGKA